MRSSRYSIPNDGIFPFLGLNTLVPAGQLNGRYSPSCVNIDIHKGRLRSRAGHEQLGSSLVGTPVAIIPFSDAAGVIRLVCVTTRRIYYYDNAGANWVEITGGNNVASATKPVTSCTRVSDVVTVTCTSHGLTAGDRVTIGGTSVSAYNATWTVASAPDANTFTFTISGTPADATGGYLQKSVDLTATEEDGLSWCVGVGSSQGTWLIFTNGVDPPRYWDGSTVACNVLARASGWAEPVTGFITCKTVAFYYNHLVLGNITGSANAPYTVCWSTAGSLVDFTSGTAGAAILGDAEGSIQLLYTLNDRLALYTEDSIYVVTYVGGGAIYIFEKLIRDSKLLSSRAVVDLGPYHLYMSTNGIYAFDGTRVLRELSEQVRPTYSKLDWEYRNRAAAAYDKPRNICYFVLPTSSTSSYVLVLEMDPSNPAERRWSLYDYATRITAFGWLETTANAPLDQLTGTIDELSGTIDSLGGTRQYPSLLLGDSSGAVHTQGYANYFGDWSQYFYDNGSPISFEWATPEFSVPADFKSVYCRCVEVEVLARGGKLWMEYAVDGNSGFVQSEAQSVYLGSQFNQVRFYVDVVARQIQVRFYSTEPFEIQWYRIWIRPDAAWD